MNEHEKQHRIALRQEIKSRKLVLKRLAYPLSLAIAAAEKEKAARLKRLDELGQYKDFQDAQDAYGFGVITEEEYDAVLDFLENKEKMEAVKSLEEHAADILQEFVLKLQRDIAGFEFELLPQKEQAKIRQRNYELSERRRQRSSAKECD